MAFDALSGNHTVRWDETDDGRVGLTEVNLAEGAVTWTASPDGVAVGGKRSTPTNKKPKVPSTETLEEVEKRVGKNTIKGICFAVLKNAGPQGMLLAEIVAETQRLGLKDWSDVRQPSNTVNACCSGDPAFVKVAPGRVGLVCLGAHESPTSRRAKNESTARKCCTARRARVVRSTPRGCACTSAGGARTRPGTLSNTRGKYREP